MKKIYLVAFFVSVFSFGKAFSQADSCVVLGCAANYGTQTTNNSLPLLTGGFPGSCYSGGVYSQVFWQFLYVDPIDGPSQDYAQAFTCTNGTIPLDIDWVVYDMGSTPPGTLTCPIDHSTWTEINCSGAGNSPAGPGTADGNLTLTAGEYYAIGIIINSNGTDPSPDPNFTFTVGTPTLNTNPLTPANCALTVLPVKLASFTAKITNCEADLNWSSSSEVDFRDYEVQYSTDGENYQTIATIASQGDGNNISQKYSYHHNSPKQGKAYYRLKMVDIDGKFEYSKIIALNLNCVKSSAFVYPNPVSDVLNISVTNGPNDVTTARLFDNNGRLLYTGKMISGTNAVDMTKFAKGIYMLTLKSNMETQNMKIVKY